MKNKIPNILTSIRLVMVPFFVLIWFNVFKWDSTAFMRYLWATVIFAAASATDFLDGYLARKNKCVSSFGKIADPIADKALTIASLVCVLCITKSVLGIIFAAIIILREVAVSVMRMIYAKKGVVLAAGLPGKIKTAFQMFGLIAAMLFVFFNAKSGAFEGGALSLAAATNIIFFISMVLTVFSGVWCFVTAEKPAKK